MKRNILKRTILFFIGLFMVSLGVSISIYSDLGVSPISSMPYTMTLVWLMDIGLTTAIFNIVLVFLQIILLRKDFRKKDYIQIFVALVFGYFTSFSLYLIQPLANPSSISIRLIYSLISIVIIASGIFIYMPQDISCLPGEGFVKAVSIRFNKPFHNIKVLFDVSMVVISLIICLIEIHSFGSVGIGTILAACLIGTTLKYIKLGFEKITGKNVDLKQNY